MPSNFKRMVRRRMAETGESWQTAARAVRERAARVRDPATGEDEAVTPNTVPGRPPPARGPASDA